MGAGPEFEYTEEELRLLAEKLVNNEELRFYVQSIFFIVFIRCSP